jgi:hypothetical protein
MRHREARKKKRALSASLEGKKKPSDYAVPVARQGSEKDQNESAG